VEEFISSSGTTVNVRKEQPVGETWVFSALRGGNRGLCPSGGLSDCDCGDLEQLFISIRGILSGARLAFCILQRIHMDVYVQRAWLLSCMLQQWCFFKGYMVSPRL
jgi:hypothetical protein